MDGTDPRLELVHRFFAGTGASYDFMVNFATLGIDRAWKRRIAALVPAGASRVLDLACGTGLSTLAIARAHPDAEVVGVELREEYLDIARAKVARLGLRNVELVLARAEDYRSQQPFDCISSSYLAKYADLARLTRNGRAMLREGGVLVMHDFTLPPKPYLVAIWRAYFKVLQGPGSRVFPAWREIYYGLPELIARTRWREELQEALRREGFRDIRTDHLFAYGSAIVTARK
jgi:demethylmenaquinone methyltransferase / 2-methoxy-6-polyprenyl-1,4-benzoquinol methylase